MKPEFREGNKATHRRVKMFLIQPELGWNRGGRWGRWGRGRAVYAVRARAWNVFRVGVLWSQPSFSQPSSPL